MGYLFGQYRRLAGHFQVPETLVTTYGFFFLGFVWKLIDTWTLFTKQYSSVMKKKKKKTIDREESEK